MLSAFTPGSNGLARVEPDSESPLPKDALWLDLLDPTPADEKRLEATLDIEIPTREEMREIESSNRLYEDGGALFMTYLQNREQLAAKAQPVSLSTLGVTGV